MITKHSIGAYFIESLCLNLEAPFKLNVFVHLDLRMCFCFLDSLDSVSIKFGHACEEMCWSSKNIFRSFPY